MTSEWVSRVVAGAGPVDVVAQGVVGADDEWMLIENPATEQVIARVRAGSADDVARAVTRAQAAFPAWSARSPLERAEAMRELARRIRGSAEDFARLDTLNGGNPIRWTRRDVEVAAMMLEYFAGMAAPAREELPNPPGGRSESIREPYGVVGHIAAYNHPFASAVNKCAASIAVGNTAVVKPADPTPLSAIAFAELADEVLSPGVITVVPGRGDVAGDALVRDPRVERLSFTGSVRVGEQIRSNPLAAHKHINLELGGKNPLIVFPDADLSHAVEVALQSTNFAGLAGQSCTSMSRMYVHEDIAEAFGEALRAAADQLIVGDPLDEATDVGPLSFRARRDAVWGAVVAAAERGHLLLDGRETIPAAGYFVGPTIVGGLPDEHPVVRDEVFGPVVSLHTWTDEEDVIRRANDTPFGLAAAVVGGDAARCRRVAGRLVAGSVLVNGGRLAPGLPFGGWRASGFGKELCPEDAMSYTRQKIVVTGDAR